MGTGVLSARARRGHTTGHGGSSCAGIGSHLIELPKYFFQLASDASAGTPFSFEDCNPHKEVEYALESNSIRLGSDSLSKETHLCQTLIMYLDWKLVSCIFRVKIFLKYS